MLVLDDFFSKNTDHLEWYFFRIQNVFKNFFASFQEKKLESPVFIFHGPSSSGKRSLIFFWIKSLLCSNATNQLFFCDACKSCISIYSLMGLNLFISETDSFFYRYEIVYHIFLKYPADKNLKFLINEWNYVYYCLIRYYTYKENFDSIEDLFVKELNRYNQFFLMLRGATNYDIQYILDFLAQIYNFLSKKEYQWVFEKRSFSVHDIYKTKMALYKSSFMGKKKIWYLHDVKNLNIEIATSLLKLIEEPPKGVIIILGTDSLNQVLPTIRSRCILIPFLPLLEDHKKEIIQNFFSWKNEGSLDLDLDFFDLFKNYFFQEKFKNFFEEFLYFFVSIEDAYTQSKIWDFSKKIGGTTFFLSKNFIIDFFDYWIYFLKEINKLKFYERNNIIYEEKRNLKLLSKIVINYYKNCSFFVINQIISFVKESKLNIRLFRMTPEESLVSLIFRVKQFMIRHK